MWEGIYDPMGDVFIFKKGISTVVCEGIQTGWDFVLEIIQCGEGITLKTQKFKEL